MHLSKTWNVLKTLLSLVFRFTPISIANNTTENNMDDTNLYKSERYNHNLNQCSARNKETLFYLSLLLPNPAMNLVVAILNNEPVEVIFNNYSTNARSTESDIMSSNPISVSGIIVLLNTKC